MNSILLFLLISLAQAQNYQVREVERVVGERTERLIEVLRGINDPSGIGCVDVIGPSAIPEIQRARTTEEVRSCYRQAQDPRPFSGFLRPGQHMMMQKDGYLRNGPPFEGVSRSQLTGDYLLRNIAPNGSTRNRFQAILNVDFQSSDPVQKEYMLNRTRECMNAMGPYLKGPNGDNIEVKIITPGEVLPNEMPSPQAIPITVTRENRSYRGHAAAFGTNFSCTTIGHEMLHHLGLCDEYHEGMYTDPAGARHDYSCRQVTAAPSYMRNMVSAFQDTVPQTSRCDCNAFCKRVMETGGERKEMFLSQHGFEAVGAETSLEGFCVRGEESIVTDGTVGKAFSTLREGSTTVFESRRILAVSDSSADSRIAKAEITCTCPTGHPYCQRIVTQLVQRSQRNNPRAKCPDGIRAHDVNPDPGGDGRSRVEGDVLVISTPGNPNGSLLTSGQFHKILSGNCAGGSPQYESCAALAYVGPERTIPGRTETYPANICTQMPPACREDSYYLNGPAPAVPRR